MRHEDVGELAPYFTRLCLEGSAFLYGQGDGADSLYVVAAGRVELSRTDEQGRLTVCETIRNGGFFGEAALLEGERRDHGARCLDACELYYLDRRNFQRMASELPLLAAKMLGLLSEKLKRGPLGVWKEGERRPQIVSFFAAKDGVGKSFLASNFALMAVRNYNMKVCLVELDLQFGNLPSFLGMTAKKTLWDMVASESMDLVEPQLLTNYAIEIEPGLHFFQRPRDLVEAEQIEPAHVTAFLGKLQRICDLVVVDCSAGLDETTLTALDVSDRVFVVSTADFAGVAATRQLMKVFGTLRYAPRKLDLLVNMTSKERDLPPADARDLFEGVVLESFTYETKVFHCLNQGIRFLDRYPQHPITLTLGRLLQPFIEASKSSEVEAKKTSFLERWLHWVGERSAAPKKGVVSDEHEVLQDSVLHHRRGALSEFALGQAYYLVGRYDVAARAFERAIELDDSLAVAYAYLAETSLFDENTEGATFYYRMAGRFAPEKLRYRVKLALLSKGPRDVHEEIAFVRNEVEHNPSWADLRLLLALLHVHRGELDMGKNQLEKALEINPTYVEALTVRGQVARIEGDAIGAVSHLLQAIEASPGHVPALYDLGLAFNDLRLYAFAEASFRAVLSVYSGHVPTHRRILALQDPLRVLQQEMSRYGEAVRLHPHFADLHFKLAVAHYQSGEFRKALARLLLAGEHGFSDREVARLLEKIDCIVPLVHGTFLLPEGMPDSPEMRAPRNRRHEDRSGTDPAVDGAVA